VTVTKRVTRRIHGHNRKVTVKAKKAVASALLMPTTITAQNGAVIHQNTKIAVTGCAAVKSKAKKKTKAREGGKRG
jgi:predicted hydrolase (HD superfamily)